MRGHRYDWLCGEAVRSRATDIIRRRKENLGYGENYEHTEGDVKAWIDLNSP